MYFYEARTVRGVGWMSWGLLIHMAALLLSALSTIAIALILFPTLTSPPNLGYTFAAFIAVVCGLVLVEIAAAVVYLVGFHGMYSGRHEYGPDHDRTMDRALVFVILSIVLAALQVVSPFSFAGSMFLNPTTSNATAGVVVLISQSMSALFAGLALISGVKLFADGGQRGRLLVGMILGAVGAATGPAILMVGTYSVSSYSALSAAFVASALAGSGTCAISLFVFYLVYAEVRRKLESGAIPPALPRPPMLVPYYYYPPVPYPMPVPPVPASPPPASPPKP